MAPVDATLPGLSAPLLLNPDETHTIDQVLERWAGQFGPAQQLHFTLSSLAWSLHALLTLSMVFADSTPQWTCITSNDTALYLPGEGGPSIGTMDNTSERSVITGSSSSCNISSSICTMDASAWTWIGGKSQSTVSEWGLVCGKEYMISLVQSVYFLGALLGAGVYGSLSDSFLGRKGVLTLTCCLSPVCSLFTAFSPNYWTYFLLRSATGFNCGGMGLSCFVLATENIGPAKRGPVAMSAFYFFSGGIFILSTFAYFMRSWRHLYLLISVPCFLYCILALPFLTESPRWYLSRGRADDAMDVLNQIAKRNGRSIPAGIKLDKEQEDPSNQTITEQWNIHGSARCKDRVYDPPESRCVVTECLNTTGNTHVQNAGLLRNPPNQAHDPQSQNDHLDLQTLAQLQAPQPENPTLCCIERADDGPSHYIPPFNDQAHPIPQNAQNQTVHQNIIAKEQFQHFPISKIQPAQNQTAHQNIRTEEQIQHIPISKTQPPARNASILDIFRNPTTRTRMLIMMCIWLDVQITYYGINLSAYRIGSNLYLNIVLNAMVELPALAITAISLKAVGRRMMLASAMLMTGTACAVGALVWDAAGANGRLACGLVGIFGVAAAYNLIYIYTAELFPTAVRNAAMGVASQAAQVGAIMSPATTLLGEVQPWLPFGLFGGVSLMGALLALQLPETRNAPMYETLHGMEKAHARLY